MSSHTIKFKPDYAVKDKDSIYGGQYDKKEIYEKAVYMETNEILEKTWRLDRVQQGLTELLVNEHDDKTIQDIYTKLQVNKDEHFYWLLVLEQHIIYLCMQEAENGK